MKGTIYIDYEKCVACGRCELACAVEHSRSKEIVASMSEPMPPQPRIRIEASNGFSTPLFCYHCENPQCIEVCPSGAISKLETGQVILDEELCVGCGACQFACHLGVPERRRDGRAMIKCDLCMSRLELAMKPACVTACRTGSLTFEFDDKKTAKDAIIVYKKTG